MVLGVLRFDSTGPPFFTFNGDRSLEWPQGASITDVWLDSSLEAYNNRSLTLAGQSNQVCVAYLISVSILTVHACMHAWKRAIHENEKDI